MEISLKDVSDEDAEISYDVIFDRILSDLEKEVVEEAMLEAVEGLLRKDKYEVVVEDTGVQTVAVILYYQDMTPTYLKYIDQDVIEALSDQDIKTARAPFVQSR